MVFLDKNKYGTLFSQCIKIEITPGHVINFFFAYICLNTFRVPILPNENIQYYNKLF